MLKQGAVLRFPEKKYQPTFQELSPVVFEEVNGQALSDLVGVARTVTTQAKEVVAFVDQNRTRAREIGIETISIELGLLLETDRLLGVLSELERAISLGRSAKLSEEGMRRLRKAEKLVSEAQSMKQAAVRNGSVQVRMAQADGSKSAPIWIPIAIIGAVIVIITIVSSLSGSGAVESKKSRG